MLFESHKEEPWFSLLASEKKTIDGRLKKGKYGEIKPGDNIVVYSSDEKNFLKTKVLAVRYYDNFSDMIKAEGVEKILPGIKNIETAIATYRKYYSEEDEKKFGVVALEIEIMK